MSIVPGFDGTSEVVDIVERYLSLSYMIYDVWRLERALSGRSLVVIYNVVFSVLFSMGECACIDAAVAGC
ncbi:uncharacterized protein [Physcomitrium patens]|uniref:uncharacterized protein isoform X3 n=1 Tax=Physcomitrium patens TaxID=3218 RepID=UPI003CCD2C22